MLKRIFASVLAVLLILPCLALAPAEAAETQITTATYNSPVLCTTVGQSLNMLDCYVQFTEDTAPVSGSFLDFKTADGRDCSFTVTPTKAGITKLYVTELNSPKRTTVIYLVVKEKDDTDWVLFDSDGSFEYKAIQQSDGAVIKNDGTKLVLNASNSGDSYIRVLVDSDMLSAFGDYVIEAEVKLSGATADSRWGSLMYRIQNNNFPYMQSALRYDSTLSNGCEIAERTNANAWNVIKKGSAAQKKDSFTTLKTVVSGTDAVYYLDGTKELSCESTPYSRGGIGFQVRGVTMTISSLKVSVNTNSAYSNANIYASPDIAETGLSTAPFIATEITSQTKYHNLSSSYMAKAIAKNPDISLTPAAIAVFTYSVNTYNTSTYGVRVSITASNQIYYTVANIISDLNGNYIPAFRISDKTAAEKLAAELKTNQVKDAYVISTDAEVLKAVRSAWKYANTVLDITPVKADVYNAELTRATAVENGIRSIILPVDILSYENVEYLQDRYLSVWAETSGSAAMDVQATNYGVSVLISAKPENTNVTLQTYYTQQNTLTSMPNIIGHRGVPSLAQENSLAGSVKAFSLGADMVENDIYLSKDGVLVVMHDSTIDRTTNGSGTVTAMTGAQLAKYKIDVNSSVASEPIPTLEDYFKEFKGNGKTIVIELKSANTAVAKPLAQLIEKYDILDQVVVISFYTEVISALRQYLPGVSAAYLNSSTNPSESTYLKTLETLMEELQTSSTVYSPSYASGALGPKLVTALRLRGISTWGWTFNKQADFDKYFVMGLSGLTTNYSQYASKYAKRLTQEDGKLFVETYDGTKTEVKSGDSKLGKVTVSEEILGNGTLVCYFYTYTSKTASNTSYTIVSELIWDLISTTDTTAEVTSAEITTAGVTTTDISSSGGDESSLSDPAAETEASTESTELSEKTSGCASVAFAAVPAAMLLCSAVILKKKKEL